MHKLGFNDKWVSLVMQCVRTMQYQILHNGVESDSFTPERGLRQGDPFSPYLFILCAEDLSCALRDLRDKGLIHGCSITRQAPSL